MAGNPLIGISQKEKEIFIFWGSQGDRASSSRGGGEPDELFGIGKLDRSVAGRWEVKTKWEVRPKCFARKENN